jgi:hypothetical protein
MVTVAVTPGPIFFLLLRRQLAEVSVFVEMILARPLMVIDIFIVVPNVVIAVIGVINSVIVMMLARRAQYRKHQRARQDP